MKCWTGIMVISVCLLHATGLHGAPYIYGLGESECSIFTDAASEKYKDNSGNSADYYDYLNWFYGYATSLSLCKEVDALGVMGAIYAAPLLESYCSEHPGDTFLEATQRVVLEIIDLRRRD